MEKIHKSHSLSRAISLIIVFAFTFQQVSFAEFLSNNYSLATNAEIHGPAREEAMDAERAVQLLHNELESITRNVAGAENQAAARAALIDLRRRLITTDDARQAFSGLGIAPDLYEAWILTATQPLMMATGTVSALPQGIETMERAYTLRGLDSIAELNLVGGMEEAFAEFNLKIGNDETDPVFDVLVKAARSQAGTITIRELLQSIKESLPEGALDDGVIASRLRQVLDEHVGQAVATERDAKVGAVSRSRPLLRMQTTIIAVELRTALQRREKSGIKQDTLLSVAKKLLDGLLRGTKEDELTAILQRDTGLDVDTATGVVNEVVTSAQKRLESLGLLGILRERDADEGLAVSNIGILPHKGKGNVNEQIAKCITASVPWFVKHGKITQDVADAFYAAQTHGEIAFLPLDAIEDKGASKKCLYLTRMRVVKLPVKELGRINKQLFTGHLGLKEGVAWIAVGTEDEPRDPDEIELDILHEAEEYNIALREANKRKWSMAKMAQWRDGEFSDPIYGGFAKAKEFFQKAHIAACEVVFASTSSHERLHRKALESLQLARGKGPKPPKVKPSELKEASAATGIAVTSTHEAEADEGMPLEVIRETILSHRNDAEAVQPVLEDLMMAFRHAGLLDLRAKRGQTAYPVTLEKYRRLQEEGVLTSDVIYKLGEMVSNRQFCYGDSYFMIDANLALNALRYTTWLWDLITVCRTDAGPLTLNQVARSYINGESDSGEARRSLYHWLERNNLARPEGQSVMAALVADTSLRGESLVAFNAELCEYLRAIMPAGIKPTQAQRPLPAFDAGEKLAEHIARSEFGEAAAIINFQIGQFSTPANFMLCMQVALARLDREGRLGEIAGEPIGFLRVLRVAGLDEDRGTRLAAYAVMSYFLHERDITAQTAMVRDCAPGHEAIGIAAAIIEDHLGRFPRDVGITPQNVFDIRFLREQFEGISTHPSGAYVELVEKVGPKLIGGDDIGEIELTDPRDRGGDGDDLMDDWMDLGSGGGGPRPLRGDGSDLDDLGEDGDDDSGFDGLGISQAGVLPHRKAGNVNDCIVQALAECIKSGSLKIAEPHTEKFIQFLETRKPGDDIPQDSWIPIEQLSDSHVTAADGRILHIVRLPVSQLGIVAGRPFYAHVGMKEGIIWVASERNEAEVEADIMHEKEEYDIAAQKAKREGKTIVEIALWRDGKVENGMGIESVEGFFNNAHRRAWENVIAKLTERIEELSQPVDPSEPDATKKSAENRAGREKCRTLLAYAQARLEDITAPESTSPGQTASTSLASSRSREAMEARRAAGVAITSVGVTSVTEVEVATEMLARRHINALDEARDMHAPAIVRSENEIILPEEYLYLSDELDFRSAIKSGNESPDVTIVPLEIAKQMFASDLKGGKKKRIILLKEEDVDAEVRAHASGNSNCKVLALGNYNFLHLGSALEFARSALSYNPSDAGSARAAKAFYELLMFRPISAEELPAIMSMPVIILMLPAIDTEIIPPNLLRELQREYASFIQAA